MASLPTLSLQENNCILRSHMPLESFIETVHLAVAAYAGEWVVQDPNHTGWIKATGAQTGMAFPVTGGSNEASRQVMKRSIGETGYNVPVYMGPPGYFMDTKLYDADDVPAKGGTCWIKTMTINNVARSVVCGTVGQLTLVCGQCLEIPADNNGFLRLLVWFGPNT